MRSKLTGIAIPDPVFPRRFSSLCFFSSVVLRDPFPPSPSPGLYIMYSHMMSQRRRAIGKGFWGDKAIKDAVEKKKLEASKRKWKMYRWIMHVIREWMRGLISQGRRYTRYAIPESSKKYRKIHLYEVGRQFNECHLPSSLRPLLHLDRSTDISLIWDSLHLTWDMII